MEDINEILSPDKQYSLSLFDSSEPHMGLLLCKFSLKNNLTKEIYEFPDIWVLANRRPFSAWSENSRFFSLAIYAPINSVFVFDTQNKEFSILKFSNIFVLDIRLIADKLSVNYVEDQIPDRVERNNYPTKEFIKPNPLSFDFKTLTWFDIKKLRNYQIIGNDTELYCLDAIDKGWRKFKGTLPQTTEIIVWELKRFAEYGDRQSIEWMTEILCKEKEPDNWTKSSKYIGFKQRI
jgi:hypothetical protein